MIPFAPTGDRVVIKADVEERVPEETASGLLTAKTLAAAVEGSDREDSWFVGTIVALGPLVNQFEIRPFILRQLRQLEEFKFMKHEQICALRHAIEDLPCECPDPLRVGDRVTFSWAAGQQMTIDGERFLILKASEVLAVLAPEERYA